MQTLYLLPLLAMLVLPVQNPPTPPPDGSQIAVLSFKWSRSRQAGDASASDKPVPSRAVTTADKNLERSARANDPAGKRDPNADTLDARGQALEAITQAANKKDKTIEGFAYQVKLHNTSKQTVRSFSGNINSSMQTIQATLRGVSFFAVSRSSPIKTKSSRLLKCRAREIR